MLCGGEPLVDIAGWPESFTQFLFLGYSNDRRAFLNLASKVDKFGVNCELRTGTSHGVNKCFWGLSGWKERDRERSKT